MKNINKFEHESEWSTYIGKPIIKHSNKPFKNGKKINIVKAISINPKTNKQAFVVEDDSFVDCYQCKIEIEII